MVLRIFMIAVAVVGLEVVVWFVDEVEISTRSTLGQADVTAGQASLWNQYQVQETGT